MTRPESSAQLLRPVHSATERSCTPVSVRPATPRAITPRACRRSVTPVPVTVAPGVPSLAPPAFQWQAPGKTAELPLCPIDLSLRSPRITPRRSSSVVQLRASACAWPPAGGAVVQQIWLQRAPQDVSQTLGTCAPSLVGSATIPGGDSRGDGIGIALPQGVAQGLPERFVQPRAPRTYA